MSIHRDVGHLLNFERTRKPQQRAAGERGFTLIELLIVVAVIAAIAAIAVPSMLRARMTADETAAVSSMRAINSAQASYSAAAAPGAYAVDLATLGRSCTPGVIGFLSPDLAMNPAVKNGYRYQVQAASGSSAGPNDCNGTGTRTGYYTTSVPVSSSGGQKAFASNTAASIYFSMSGVAPTEASMAPGGGAMALR